MQPSCMPGWVTIHGLVGQLPFVPKHDGALVDLHIAECLGGRIRMMVIVQWEGAFGCQVNPLKDQT
eukprot:2730033-Amphidinium_carterae.1